MVLASLLQVSAAQVDVGMLEEEDQDVLSRRLTDPACSAAMSCGTSTIPALLRPLTTYASKGQSYAAACLSSDGTVMAVAAGSGSVKVSSDSGSPFGTRSRPAIHNFRGIDRFIYERWIFLLTNYGGQSGAICVSIHPVEVVTRVRLDVQP